MTAVCITIAGAAGYGIFRLTKTKSPYPSQWDERIKPLADRASEIRGLPFLHPVRAIFHSEQDFIKLVTHDTTATPNRTKQNDRDSAVLRAVGLAQGKLDLGAQSNQLNGAGILAYYSPIEKQIHIRGTQLGVDLKTTLVHELTHALQDQHFDLRKIQRKGAQTRSDAARTVYEGDANWVEQEYVKSLPKTERDQLNAANDSKGAKYQRDTQNIPDILSLEQQAPYEFGPILIEMLRQNGGQSGVDDALRSPPVADFLVFNPIWLLDARTANVPSAASAPAGASNIEHNGELGAVDWYATLSERVDPKVVLTALDGWAGDEYTSYTKDGTQCAALSWRASDADARDRMHGAMILWQSEMPKPSLITITDRSSTIVDLTACDPGVDAKAVTHRSKTAITVPFLRVAFTAGFMTKGIKLHQAWCAADRAVKHFSMKQLSDDKFFVNPAFATEVRLDLARCA